MKIKQFVSVIIAVSIMLSTVCVGGATGYKIAPQYDLVDNFYEDLARVKLNGKWGYIDRSGNAIIPFRYEMAGNFSEGLAGVQDKGYWYFIDKNDKKVIEVDSKYSLDYGYDSSTKLDIVSEFSSGQTIVKDKNDYYVIDRQQKIIGNSKGYARIYVTDEYMIGRTSDNVGQTDFINITTGSINTVNSVLSLINKDTSDLRKKIYYAKPNEDLCFNKYSSPLDTIYNSQGNEMFTFLATLQNPENFSENIVRYSDWRNGNIYSGYVNINGQYLNSQLYEKGRVFSEGMAAVKMNDLWGFINTSGQLVIDYQLDSVGDFNHGVALVEKRGYFGYIDKTGKFIVEPKYTKKSDFTYGYALVSEEESDYPKYDIIDTTGKILLSFESKFVDNNNTNNSYTIHDIYFLNERFVHIKLGKNENIIDINTGKWVLPNDTKDFIFSYDNLVAVRDSSYKWGFVELK